jgi:hypothetical protein
MRRGIEPPRRRARVRTVGQKASLGETQAGARSMTSSLSVHQLFQPQRTRAILEPRFEFGSMPCAGEFEGGTMLTKMDAEKGKRIVWRSPDTSEVRYGTITWIIDNIEVVIAYDEVFIAYDDGGIACAYVGNTTLSNVSPA